MYSEFHDTKSHQPPGQGLVDTVQHSHKQLEMPVTRAAIVPASEPLAEEQEQQEEQETVYVESIQVASKAMGTTGERVEHGQNRVHHSNPSEDNRDLPLRWKIGLSLLSGAMGAFPPYMNTKKVVWAVIGGLIGAGITGAVYCTFKHVCGYCGGRRSAVSPDSFCAKLQGFAFSPISSLIGLMLIPMAICLMILHPLLPLLSCLGKLLSILTCECCCSESSCETNVQFSDYVDLLAIAGAMVFSPFTSFYTLFLHCTYGGSAK